MEPVDDPRLYSGRYQVTHLIARGGMAIVYRAQDVLLNRPVALKTLYPELSDDPLFVERFRREAQAAANLSHPNIVPVFDWGEDKGTYFIVMELVDGTSLADMLRGGRTLTASHSASLMAQVAAALGYAHRNDVVHRDIKPGNILIASDGQVKVTDFGIAQAMSVEDQLAEEGSVMGTATYFSPEQAEGAALDGRSDIYSLGIVLYEMLAGRPPFIGDTPVAVSTQHVNASVPLPSEFNNTIPGDLQAIVMEALAKSPDKRYQSADELRADLLRFSEGQPVRAAQREVAFFGVDATRAVPRVTPGERTQAVPMMKGPRTDVRRRRNNHTGTIVTVIILLLAVGGLAYFFLQKSSGATLPSVIGQPVATATQTLKLDGVSVRTVSVHSTQKPGTVLKMDPKVGSKITHGERVTLTVSLGPQTAVVTVPDVTKMSLSAALNVLNNTPYLFNTTVKQTIVVPPGGAVPGDVVQETPSVGTKVHAGDKMIVTVLSQAAQFPVPSLTGDPPTLAAQKLGQSQLTVGPTTKQLCSNTIGIGLVVGSFPAQGALVNSGTAIDLIISKGFCKILVPSVIGEPQARGTAILQADHFSPQTSPQDPSTCAPSQVGTIVAQSASPAIGTYAPYNSTITISVCFTSTLTTPTTTTTAPG